MKEWIADYVKGCATCQQNKILTHRQKIPTYRIPSEPGALPFQSIAMDLITGCRERSSHHLEFQLSREQVLVNLP